MRRCLLVALAATLLARNAAPQPASKSVEVVVERAQGDDWETVDARTVFKPDQQIRFRFRSNFPGYLYVLDETSAGAYVWLFPDSNTGLNNQVQAGEWSLVPATRGAFGIPKTPGFETLYWILSPVPLRDLSSELTPPSRSPQRTMVPRCDEPVLKARGACLDRNAGPKPLGDTARLQQVIGSGATLRSRDLAFDRTSKANIVKAKNLAGDALVYEFWIAHQ